ncbi:MAG: Kae1-associated serine/threonine protein kinase [Candidatus Aenigmarchaeota archaeon]|nr:Kae1-associated serine/threonine protein kinase [Candidatus Aenigmarchaeota archaeon]
MQQLDPMNIIAQGAEAILYKENNKIIKQRIEKKYRIKQIDEYLRKTRTKKEAKLITEARRLGINVPKIISVDKFKIVMEFIDGIKLRDLINNIESNKRKEIAQEIGNIVGILHTNHIVHGDLTTSNMILKDNKIFLIDFGLGDFTTRKEDYATDLSVLKEAFKSTHYKYLNELWDSFILGYKQSNNTSKEVFETLEKIKLRGRYIKRKGGI